MENEIVENRGDECKEGSMRVRMKGRTPRG